MGFCILALLNVITGVGPGLLVKLQEGLDVVELEMGQVGASYISMRVLLSVSS